MTQSFLIQSFPQEKTKVKLHVLTLTPLLRRDYSGSRRAKFLAVLAAKSRPPRKEVELKPDARFLLRGVEPDAIFTFISTTSHFLVMSPACSTAEREVEEAL